MLSRREMLRNAVSALMVAPNAPANLIVQSGPRGGAGGGGGGSSLYSGFTPTLYAAPTDQGTGDGSSEANAMDLPTALATIAADGILGILPGVYSGSPPGGAAAIFTTTNQGTSGHPIIICCKYPAYANIANTALLSEFRSSSPVANTGIPADDGNRPVLGVYSRNYVHFYGAYADQTYAPPRPSHGMFVVRDSTGCKFNDWASSQVPQPDIDNYNSLFSQASPDLTVSRFYATGGSRSGDNHNSSVITTYGCLNFLIEYGSFDGVNQAIFIKGTAASNTIGHSGTIRYCKSVDAGAGMIDVAVVVGSAESPGNKVYVHHNLSIRDGALAGAAMNSDGSGEGNRDTEFYNNTIVTNQSAGGGALMGGNGSSFNMQAMVFKDNVVAFLASSSNHPLNIEDVGSSAFTTLSNNLYYESGGTAVFADRGSTYSGIANWQTQTGKESGSTEGNPSFDNAGADDYRRTSSGDTGSSTGGKRGCYVTGSEQIGDGVH